MVQLGAIVKAADRLETLAEAQHRGSTEHHNSLHDAHCSDGSIAVDTGSLIQTDGGYTGKALTGQGGETASQNHIPHVS